MALRLQFAVDLEIAFVEIDNEISVVTSRQGHRESAATIAPGPEGLPVAPGPPAVIAALLVAVEIADRLLVDHPGYWRYHYSVHYPAPAEIR